jgi:hypothetical protein
MSFRFLCSLVGFPDKRDCHNVSVHGVQRRNCKTHTGCDYIKGIQCRVIYRPFAALLQNLGGHELEDDGEVEPIVTRWLITQGRN